MSIPSDRPSRQRLIRSRSAHRCARAARPSEDNLTALGGEVIAHRLRTLGHPVRVRIMRALDRREAGIEQLAAELGVGRAATAAHLRVLCRAGVVCRTDERGPAKYRLADWPSLWLVDQLARRLRGHAQLTIGAHDESSGPRR
jgi:DNA-binding transcriptional ArsR family regulator